MNDMNYILGRLEYEERIRWLRSLYGHPIKPMQPSWVARLTRRMLYVLGNTLVLGERMRPARYAHNLSMMK
jgi:hypothetical protein